MKSKHQAPQPEFAVTATAFNLIADAAVDGERVSQEIEQARADAARAKVLEQKQQPPLL